MKPALVVLAAGASRRLGQCKALAAITPRTPLELLLEAEALLDSCPALVVSGADHEQIAAGAPPGCEVVLNEGWDAGRTGSVRVAQLARPDRDLCLAPVDVPLVPAAVFEALARAWEELGAPAQGWLAPALPTSGAGRAGGARYGHPIVVGRLLVARVADWPAEKPLRDLRGLARPLASVPVQAAEILDDLDRPEDLQRLRERFRPA